MARGNARLEKAAHSKALKDYERAIELDDKLDVAHIGRAAARLWMASSDDGFDKALVRGSIADLTRALDLNPKSVDAYLGRASAWNHLDDFEKASC